MIIIFQTHLTLIGLFPSVSPYMFGMILLRKEILFAILALMLFNLQMHTLAMVNKGRIGLEGRSTFGTQVAFDIFMDGDFVDSQG